MTVALLTLLLTGAADDSRTIAFLGPRGLLFIGLRLEADGVNFLEQRGRYARTLFESYDADKNERWSTDELGRVPAAYLRPGGGPEPADLAMLGIDKADEGITVEQLVAGLTNKMDWLAIAPAPASEASSRQALFRQLDRNGDGRLDGKELADSNRLLVQLDFDDDEQISVSELAPPTSEMPRPDRMTNAPIVAIVLSPNGPPEELIKELIKRYDTYRPDGSRRIKNGRLCAEELGLGTATVAPSDKNGDADLDETELAELLKRASADLSLVVRFGSEATGKRIEVAHSEERSPPVRNLDSYTLALLFDEAHLELSVSDSSNSQAEEAQKLAERLFRGADVDKNNYLVADEVKALEPVARIFSAMDGDRDGKLFLSELSAFVRTLAEEARTRVVLDVSAHDRSLFEILDANRDRQLGRRELQSGERLLPMLDQDGSGDVAVKEIPRHYQLVLGRARLELGPLLANQATARVPLRVGAGSGPTWFEKMDHNGDGDVSRREYLGPLRHFETLDLDRNGLIDADEAAKARTQ